MSQNGTTEHVCWDLPWWSPNFHLFLSSCTISSNSFQPALSLQASAEVGGRFLSLTILQLSTVEAQDVHHLWRRWSLCCCLVFLAWPGGWGGSPKDLCWGGKTGWPGLLQQQTTSYKIVDRTAVPFSLNETSSKLSCCLLLSPIMCYHQSAHRATSTVKGTSWQAYLRQTRSLWINNWYVRNLFTGIVHIWKTSRSSSWEAWPPPRASTYLQRCRTRISCCDVTASGKRDVTGPFKVTSVFFIYLSMYLFIFDCPPRQTAASDLKTSWLCITVSTEVEPKPRVLVCVCVWSPFLNISGTRFRLNQSCCF